VIRWRRRVAGARVARAWPQLSHAQQCRLVRNSYAHLARALLWTLRLSRVVHRDGANAVARLVDIDAATRAQLTRLLPAFDDRESRSRSAIVVTGHIGVWELLPALLASSSLVPRHTQWIVYRPLHNASVNAVVGELRGGEDRRLIAVRVAECECMFVDLLMRASLAGQTLFPYISRGLDHSGAAAFDRRPRR
jgi:lauroyl/myristoyl acyltransferase